MYQDVKHGRKFRKIFKSAGQGPSRADTKNEVGNMQGFYLRKCFRENREGAGEG